MTWKSIWEFNSVKHFDKKHNKEESQNPNVLEAERVSLEPFNNGRFKESIQILKYIAYVCKDFI